MNQPEPCRVRAETAPSPVSEAPFAQVMRTEKVTMALPSQGDSAGSTPAVRTRTPVPLQRGESDQLSGNRGSAWADLPGRAWTVEVPLPASLPR